MIVTTSFSFQRPSYIVLEVEGHDYLRMDRYESTTASRTNGLLIAVANACVPTSTFGEADYGGTLRTYVSKKGLPTRFE